jgi:hypothetical protein
MPRGPVGELVRVSQTPEAAPNHAAMAPVPVLAPAPEPGRLVPA